MSSQVDSEPSLLEHLDLSQLNCLNESSEHNIKSILSVKRLNTDSTYLISDADEQLLLNISFNQAVRVKAIALYSKGEAGQVPKKVQLFTNKPALGFEDVEGVPDDEAAQTLVLEPSDFNSGKRIALRYVRFQSVKSLHIFIASNQGNEEETRLDGIDIFGVAVEATKDLSGLRNQEQQ